MVKRGKSVVQIVGISLLILASALLASENKVFAQANQTQGQANQTQGQASPTLGKFTANLQSRTGSNATGNAEMQVSPDMKTVVYTISGSDIKNVTDISISQDMGTGRYPDVVSIRTSTAEGILPEAANGTLAKGNFTAADLTGALSGAGLSDFVKAIADGKIVVRVSTTAFPLGEIIGKLNPG